MSVGRRTLVSLGWRFGASPAQLAVMVVRSVALARLLPIELFGVFVKGAAFVALASIVASFGMGSGLLNRVPETEDEAHAANVLLTLRLALLGAWLAIILGGALAFTAGDLRLVLVVLPLTKAGQLILEIPRRILARRIAHRRLAVADTAAVVLASASAVWLAVQQPSIWALLVPDVVALAVLGPALLMWRPVWRPRPAWDKAVARYFLHFGSRVLMSVVPTQALDRIDDLWTGLVLGDWSLGLYSRAYRFSTYPRAVIAAPLNAVVQGTFAELKHDRVGLSKGFFRINGLLIRFSFASIGALVLIAPELIRIVLTEKWILMLTPFRIMLVFALLDPVVVMLSGMLIAIGHPGRVVRARVLQLGALVLGLVVLGPAFGVSGVAAAVDVAVVLGIGALLHQARPMVDTSMRALWLVPSVALVGAMSAARLAVLAPGVMGADWRSLLVKCVVYLVVYMVVLLVGERARLRRLLAFAREYFAARSELAAPWAT